MNVSLRAPSADDVGWLDGWLGAVARVVAFNEIDVERPGAALLARSRTGARIMERDGTRAGVVAFRVDAPRRGVAVVELVATAPGEARRGSGMQAAALIEEELRARSVRAILAPAAETHGISMYFWIRLGYRPLLRSEWPCDLPGVAWLRRDLG